MSRLTSFVFVTLIAFVLLNPSLSYCSGDDWWTWVFGSSSEEKKEKDEGKNDGKREREAEGDKGEKEKKHVRFADEVVAKGDRRRDAIDLVSSIAFNHERGLTDQEREDLVQCLDNGAEVDALDSEFKSTCLMFAARLGDIPTVQLCLARGADPLLKNRAEANAYCLARSQPEVVRELLKSNRIDQGLVLTLVNYFRRKNRCLSADEREVIRLLLAAGAKVDARKKNTGATSLMMASDLGDLDCVCILLEAGADPYAETTEGENAFHFASKKRRKKVLEALVLRLPDDEPAEDGEDGDDKGGGAHPPVATLGAAATTGSF